MRGRGDFVEGMSCNNSYNTVVQTRPPDRMGLAENEFFEYKIPNTVYNNQDRVWR
jgi:hypothetical protein